MKKEGGGGIEGGKRGKERRRDTWRNRRDRRWEGYLETGTRQKMQASA
jgi:hypothetical protein